MQNQVYPNFEGFILKPIRKVSTSFLNRKVVQAEKKLPIVLFVSSYPPRQCGIATYSMDLLNTLKSKFTNSFQFEVCALEQGESKFVYPDEVKYVLDTSYANGYLLLANAINRNPLIASVLVQHEFGFFPNKFKTHFINFVKALEAPAIIVFHTVLSKPNMEVYHEVREIVAASKGIIVMTQYAAIVLEQDYHILPTLIEVIPHGTHLVNDECKVLLKEKYGLSDKLILSTFGLISSGKGIGTTLKALPAILAKFPNVMFLIIGKTHPSVVLHEGEAYRNSLEAMIVELNLQNHVKFYNAYLPTQELLQFLQLTDIYLFTSLDPNQAVSGTFSYALSCGCAMVSTPIPHAKEVLNDNTGIIVDFNNPDQLSEAVSKLLADDNLLQVFKNRSMQKAAYTAWENSAVAHALFFKKLTQTTLNIQHRLPEIKLNHLRKMTDGFGMFQFSIINMPDPSSGYTLDDNARALIASCMHFQLTRDEKSYLAINKYLNFIDFCQQPNGSFLNYVDLEKNFTSQNDECNLSDANGRAVWALGYLISLHQLLPGRLIQQADNILNNCFPEIEKMHSPRAMAFAIKGLYYANKRGISIAGDCLIDILGTRLYKMYKHEADGDWLWYESYLTYANSLLPEAMLMAGLTSRNFDFIQVAKQSFDFLISKIFVKDQIKVVSNQTWMHKGAIPAAHGEQPIEICYTILALDFFIENYPNENFQKAMVQSFNWFLGNNHLNQIIYNPCTGGCYDGLEATQVNLNQGAESLVSYLMSRFTIEKYVNVVI